MMKYFKLSLASDPKIIGVQNGIHQGEIKWKKFQDSKVQDTIMEYFSLERYRRNLNEIEPCNFQIEYVEAYKTASLTDFFGFTPHLWGVEFLVTDNVKNLFDQFRLPVHSYIPANVYHKDKLYKYWALYIPYSYRFDSVDFGDTVFFKGSELSGKEYLQFANEEDWNKNKAFGVEKLVFNGKLDSTLDLFATSLSSMGYYISARLKEAIGKAGLTGMAMKEPKEPELVFG